MIGINKNNFDRFLTEKIDLKWSFVTESLESVSWLDRFLHWIRPNNSTSFGLDSIKLCENIEKAFKSHNKDITSEQYNCVHNNLYKMSKKFGASKNVAKADRCKTILNRIYRGIALTATPKTYRYSEQHRNSY